jgi:hypothetical protein
MMPTHHRRIAAEGGRALGGVEDAESPGGAGAEVEEAIAVAEGGLGEFDRARDGLALRRDRVGDAAVLGVHEVDDRERAGEVDVGAARVAALGDPGIEHVGAGSERGGGAPGRASVSPAVRRHPKLSHDDDRSHPLAAPSLVLLVAAAPASGADHQRPLGARRRRAGRSR